jgi:hypothetical protein
MVQLSGRHLRLVPDGGMPGAGRRSARRRDWMSRCSCAHGRPAHAHYRRGTECAFCGCYGFCRRPLGRLLRRGPGRPSAGLGTASYLLTPAGAERAASFWRVRRLLRT